MKYNGDIEKEWPSAELAAAREFYASDVTAEK